MTGSGWLQADRSECAAERILDGASILFAQRGVSHVGMAEVARAVGCSRQTLYRYFEDREALRMAYVNREARRIGNAVAQAVADRADPAERLADAVMTSITHVRSDKALAAWFCVGDTGVTAGLAQASVVIEGMVAGFLGDTADPDVRMSAQWIVRAIVSLLSTPGGSAAEERLLIDRFLVPVVGASAHR